MNHDQQPTDKVEPSKPADPARKRSRIIVTGIVAIALVLWLLLTISLVQDRYGLVDTTDRLTPSRDGNVLNAGDETNISGVAERVSPSVVSILTTSGQTSFWFGDSYASGAGSGLVVDSSGIILTNKHVVNNVSNLQVIMADGTTHDNVEVIATDPLNDLAFLRVKDAGELTPIELGDSTTAQVGQRVIAIGNSLGQYQNTVTSGIISGANRPVAASDGTGAVEQLTDLLQTDAAINPGNSGGPLLNSAGQVIGINTAIAEDAEGIGFAIPVNAAKGILKQILDGNTSPKRAFLGVSYTPVNAQVARDKELTVNLGALVGGVSGRDAVVSGSPADKAGIRSGDVITKIGDVEVGPRGGVVSLIAEYAPGDKVSIELDRSGDKVKIEVTLSAYSS